MKHFTIADLEALADAVRGGCHGDYYAMYSTVYGGAVTDPGLMMIPIDDHMVHRGDGVFEAAKCVDGKIYNLGAHLERLERSAGLMELALPRPVGEIGLLVSETVCLGGHANCGIRIYASRGTGSFGVNPYDCAEQHLYIVVTRLKPPFMEQHPEGARVASSRIAPKEGRFARAKTCNYAVNVMMKAEAVRSGVDFVAGFDERGCLTEGATENIGIVTRGGELVFPELEGILRGTTMVRCMELARGMVGSGGVDRVCFGDIAARDITAAAEALITGTTCDVTRVREFDGQLIGDGRAGPVFSRLAALLRDDILHNRDLQTPVFPDGDEDAISL